MASNINIKISADVQQAVNGINNINKSLDKMHQATESTSSKFIRLSSIIVGIKSAFSVASNAISAVANASRAVIEAYSAQEQAEIRLQATLQATQNACGMTAVEMLDFAESISNVTAYSDQEVLAVEQMLAATRMVGEDVIPEATMAILDMAAATGEDAANAAQRLAQALSDPAGEIESLKEAGIQLSEEQRKNITAVQEQNGIYEAQLLLLEEVEATYGGMAKAIANTDTGKLQKISDVWQDIKEGLGEGLLNSISPALDTIYRQLLNISDWINGANAYEVATGYNPDLSGFSTQSLENARSQAKDNLRQWEDWWLADPRYIEELKRAIENIDGELKKRGVKQEGTPWWEEAISGLEKDRTISVDWSQYGLSRSVMMPIANKNAISDAFNLSGADYSEVLWDIARENTPKLTSEEALSSFINSNSSLSSSFQLNAINSKLTDAIGLLDSVDYGSEKYDYLMEIIAALEEQKKAFEEVTEAEESWADSFNMVLSSLSESISTFCAAFTNAFDLAAEIAEAELDRIEEKWDEYFENLNDSQESQRDTLSAMLGDGQISYQDYIDAINNLDKERNDAEEEALAEKESAYKKANELNKVAFDAEKANSIAQATINAALGITDIWANYSGNPVLAGILTGISAAATATEIATISSQKYTPLASGGIVQSPTKALIGEGGYPEMVLPLTESNMDRFGFIDNGFSGVINFTINIGTSYNGDQLAEDIFRGIERAQRTGALPKWRYA